MFEEKTSQKYMELTSNSHEASNSQIFIAVLVLSFWSYEARWTFVFIVALLSPSSSITGVCSAPIQMFKTEKRPSLKITVRLGMPYDLHILLNAVTVKFLTFIYFIPCSVLNITNSNSSSSYNNLKRYVLSYAFDCRVYSGTEWLGNFSRITQLLRGRARTRTSHLAPECVFLSAMLCELAKRGISSLS